MSPSVTSLCHKRPPPVPLSPISMPFPKPQSRASARRAKARHKASVIASVRRQIAQRDTTCRVCGKAFGWGEQTPEMHELTSRAALRGKPPEEIFTPENCVLLHRSCHRDVTEHRVTLAPVHLDRGATGDLVSERRQTHG